MTTADADREEWSAADRVAVARLAGLHHMTTSRLRSLVSRLAPTEAVEVLSAGAGAAAPALGWSQRHPELMTRWRRDLEGRSADRVETELDRLAVRVLGPGDEEWPAPLRVDPDPPAVLFVRGRLHDRPRRVAVVGTRNPTERGRQVAARFGHQLAEAGLSVVSGLALGIDGAAHRGALSSSEAPPIAVVANGHDRPYPRRHAALWRQVADRGAVITEWPPGTAPDAYRFPQRNRIIAGISEVVVVVESRETGGSLLTARDAAERGVHVMAVPGPPDSRASRGTNQLVQDGAALVLDVDDIVTHLGLDHSRSGSTPFDPRPQPVGDEVVLLDAVRHAPTTVERLSASLQLDVGAVAIGLARLERSGWVFEVDGWFEALDEWAALLR